MLGAVGLEFFPILIDADFFGLTLGFLAGISLICVLSVIDDLFSKANDTGNELVHLHRCHSGRDIPVDTTSYGTMLLSDLGISADAKECQFDDQTEKSPDDYGSESGESDSAESSNSLSVADEASNLLLSSSAAWVLDPKALETLGKNEVAIRQAFTNFKLIVDLLCGMQRKSASLVSMAIEDDMRSAVLSSLGKVETPAVNKQLTIDMAENIADSLDSDIHRLQYLVDHCRRILEGSASSFTTGSTGFPISLISSRRSRELEMHVAHLVKTATDILQSFAHAPLQQNITSLTSNGDMAHTIQDIHNTRTNTSRNKFSLPKIYSQLKSMHERLDSMHSTVDRAAFRYKRRKAKLGPIPEAGSRIPLSLVLPVVIDCCCDGFMIGLSSVLSAKAGLVLGCVTFIEMGALGAAFGLRVRKCSGNSKFLRILALTLPPLCILGFCTVGIYMGTDAKKSQSNFLLSISIGFGTVALIQLAVVELLAEAFSTGAGVQIYATYFFGIWINISLDRIQDVLLT